MVVYGFQPASVFIVLLESMACMSRPQAQVVAVSPAQQELLQSLICQRSCPQSLALRARIILDAASGQSNELLAQRLGCSVPTIRKWRQRWADGATQLAATDQHPQEQRALITAILADAPRTGAPSSFTAAQITGIINLASTLTELPALPTNWTFRELADEAVRQGIVPSISARSVGRFLNRRRFEKNTNTADSEIQSHFATALST
jgi:putative transposase